MTRRGCSSTPRPRATAPAARGSLHRLPPAASMPRRLRAVQVDVVCLYPARRREVHPFLVAGLRDAPDERDALWNCWQGGKRPRRRRR